MERLFEDRSKLVKPVSALIAEDMVPCKVLELRSNSDTSPLLSPHDTPVQVVTGSDPVPQGALVAVATEQSQPLISEDGQLVMPSLKAHKALASDTCWLEVGAIVGDDAAADGTIVGGAEGCNVGCPQVDVTGVLQS